MSELITHSSIEGTDSNSQTRQIEIKRQRNGAMEQKAEKLVIMN